MPEFDGKGPLENGSQHLRRRSRSRRGTESSDAQIDVAQKPRRRCRGFGNGLASGQGAKLAFGRCNGDFLK